MDLLSDPIMTLSLASSNSIILTLFLPLRADNRAASFTRLAKSAPENPGVPRARVLVITSEDKGTFFIWTFKIFSLPIISGLGTTTCLSNRPGLNNAGSKTSGLLVAATRITPSFVSKPSISTSS